MSQASRSQQIAHGLARRRDGLRAPRQVVEGRLTRMVGLTLEAMGCHAAIGSRCEVRSLDGSCIEAEVVGFANERTYLMPVGDMDGFLPQSRVIPTANQRQVPVGEGLLGRVLDGVCCAAQAFARCTQSRSTRC